MENTPHLPMLHLAKEYDSTTMSVYELATREELRRFQWLKGKSVLGDAGEPDMAVLPRLAAALEWDPERFETWEWDALVNGFVKIVFFEKDGTVIAQVVGSTSDHAQAVADFEQLWASEVNWLPPSE